MKMEESRALRRPLLLLSRKLEAAAPSSISSDGCSVLAETDITAPPNEKGSQIQLLAIANKTPNITLLQTLPKRGGKGYSEFPVDRNRAVFPGLHLGASFSSYMELTELMHRFQKAKGVHLYIRSSRKLYPAVNNMGGTVRDYNLSLMFADIYYSCTKGGRRFCRSSSSNSSAQQEVRNCPFNIKLRLTRDGQRLYIRDIYPAHNHYLDRNSQPRIPHPSIMENKLRPTEKTPVLQPRTREIQAVINKDFIEDGKRLVLLSKTPQRLLPMTITASDDSTFGTDDEDPRVVGRTFPDSPIKRNFDGTTDFAASGTGSASAQDNTESCMEMEPECILGMEEKIVPDIDGAQLEEAATDGRVSTETTTSHADIKPCIKEEVLDEYPASIPPFHSDIDLPCPDEGFVISRQQIIELVKFCSQCGSRIASRYYSDRSGSLGVALICSGGHTVELSLGKQGPSDSSVRRLRAP